MSIQSLTRNSDLSNLNVGDCVYHVRFGKCKVVTIYPEAFGVHCNIYCYKINDYFLVQKDGRIMKDDHAPSVWKEEPISNIPIIYEDKYITVKYNPTGEIFIDNKDVELRIGPCTEGLQITSYGTFFVPINDGFKVTART